MVWVTRIGRWALIFGFLLVLIPALAMAEAPGTSRLPEEPAAPDDLAVTLWYGNSQSFGVPGNPQNEINIVGNVQQAFKLSYSLNGRRFEPLAFAGMPSAALSLPEQGARLGWGGLNEDPVPLGAGWVTSPDLVASARLERSGDFNVEILAKDLVNGVNTLILKAERDTYVLAETVTLNYQKGNTWPLPYSIDWSQATDITDVVDVVDGEWDLNSSGIRPKANAYGYDRMVVLGDVTWEDYEVTVPVTIHNVLYENSGGVGVVTRWKGHFQLADEQPGHGWWNIGAYAFYKIRDRDHGGEQLVMLTGKTVLHEDTTGKNLDEDKTYNFKLRVQTKNPGDSGYYSFKVWEPGKEAEPDAWLIEAQDGLPDEMFSGAVGLIAHDIDASFGDVEVVPVLDVDITTVGGGTVQATPALVNPADAYLYGDTVQLQATADTGWTFAGWSGDLSGSETVKTLNLTSDIEALATFVQGDAKKLDVQVVGSGQVDPTPAGWWYAEGTTVKLALVADTGWEFDDWSGADAGALQANSDGTWSMVMSDDRSLIATFAKKKYPLTVNVTGQGTVAKNPDQPTYEFGSQVQLTPNPSSGWTFTSWSGDLTGSVSPETILIDGPKTVTAHFGDVGVGPLEYDSHTVDDDQLGASVGNGDGIVFCGETIELSVDAANQGTETATGVSASISTESPYVTWKSSTTSSYPNIAGQEKQRNSSVFVFEVADTAPNEHRITFDFPISSSNGGLYYDTFKVPVACDSEGSVDLQVKATSDDAEERQGGRVYLKGSDLELVEDDDGPQTVGIRFPKVDAPQGTSIAEAYLTFTADEAHSGLTSLTFNCQAADDPPTFIEDDRYISSLPRGATSVAWLDIPSWTTGERYRAPNLAPIVQEIVNRTGWQPDNALAFIITGQGCRTAESYDGNAPREAPRLHITYGREPTCYTLAASAAPAAGGTVERTPAPNCAGDKYIEGTQVTLTATANVGWFFTGWSGDVLGSTNPKLISMDGDKTVSAGFVQDQYLLSVSIVGTGTVTREPDQPTYTYGTQVKLTATASGDSVFAGWSGALSGTTNPAWLTMNGHKSVTAIFGQVGPLAYDSHAIDDDETGASNGNDDGFVDCGETVEMTVTLLNQGSAGAETVNATISTTDSYIDSPLGNASSSYGNIAGLGTADNASKFEFSVSADTPHLHYATFNLNATASNGGPWPISFQVPIACMANAGKVDTAVVASSDDAEEQNSDGTVTVNESSLELGQGDLGPQWVGLRFQSLVIPQGATIGDAYVEFTAAQTDGSATTVSFTGQDSDDTLPFASASAHDISTRLPTSASVTWSAMPGWSVGQTYKSPNLAPIVQEIVDRGGWSPGNSLVLRINGSGRRTAFSYDGEPALAPRLTITFGGELTCYTLGATVTPADSGTLESKPGANCGADQYLEGTSIQLEAKPALDHTFSGWSGDQSGTENPASIIMDADKQVTASFTLETCYTLTTGVNPPGTGILTANPEPNCGGGKYVTGTSVELTAVPLGAYVFDSWTGPVPPSTDNPLTVIVEADRTITANFATCFSLTAVGLPYGTGTVEMVPPPNCDETQYRGGTEVQLTAVPSLGYSFLNWDGAATGTDNPATVVVNVDMVVTATFEEGTCRSLSLRASPTGSGTVSADKPPDCEGTKYTPGTVLELTATPRAGFKFLGWSGAATGTANPTTIVVGNLNTATAEFGLVNVVSTIRLPILAR